MTVVAVSGSLSVPQSTVTTAAAAANDSALTLVGDLPVDPSTPLLAEPVSRRVLALFSNRIDAYDPFTLQLTKSLSLAPYETFSPLVYSWAANQSLLYLLVYDSPGGVPNLAQVNPYLAIIDPVALKVLSVQSTRPFPPGIRPLGMSYSRSEDRLYVIAQDLSGGLAGDYTVMLAELDAKTGAPTWANPIPLRHTCQNLIASGLRAAVHRPEGSNKVYVPCGTAFLVYTQEPGIPGIVAVDVTHPDAPTLTTFPIAGAYPAGNSVYDPIASRMVVTSAGTGVQSQSAWIFDEINEVVVGVVNAGALNVKALGVDTVGGRLYVGIDEALLTTPYLGDRIGQATFIPSKGLVGPAVSIIPFAHRLVIPANLPGTGPAAGSHIQVFEYHLPDFRVPAVADPDASTVDMPESPNRTAASFGGDGKAFGVRMHQVAGVNGLGQNIVAPGGDYWVVLQGGKTGINDGDRVAYFSRTVSGRLSEGEASGQGVTTDGDPNTRSDYRVVTQPAPAGGDPLTPPPPGGTWPFKAASCSDLGDGRQAVVAPESSATCDLAKTTVEVETSHENANSIPGLNGDATVPILSFGSSSSSTKLIRDSKQGIVVESKAVSRDINIGGVVHIGKITSIARSSAAGRSKTATASYERLFEDVVTPSGSCAQDCHPQSVVDQINLALAPKFSAELPLQKLTATPGGARGSALIDPWKHRQDVVLNNQAETDLEIPAFRLVYVNDNASRSRIIFDFAATMANSSYSIYLLDSDSSSEDQPDDFSLAEQFAGSGLGDVGALVDGTLSGPGSGDVAPGPLNKGLAELARNDRFGRRLGHGLRLLLTGRRALLLNALLWSLLSAPVFLIGRRRYLLRLIGSSREQL